MAHFSLTVVDRLSCRCVLPGWLSLRCHSAPIGLAASVGVEISVSNDLLSVRAPAPVTRCSLRLSTTVEGPEEATPSLRRRAAQARNLLGSPPPAPKPRRDAALPKRLPFFQYRPHGYHPSLEETPECHESLAGHGHHPNPSQALAP